MYSSFNIFKQLKEFVNIMYTVCYVFPFWFKLYLSVLTFTLQQSVWYLCERLRWCLSELCRLLSGPTDHQEPSGSFLLQIDLALDYLESSDQLSEEFDELLDDLVSQAVTVAKVTGSVHFQEITAACQKVSLLRSSKKLKIVYNFLSWFLS